MQALRVAFFIIVLAALVSSCRELYTPDTAAGYKERTPGIYINELLLDELKDRFKDEKLRQDELVVKQFEDLQISFIPLPQEAEEEWAYRSPGTIDIVFLSNRFYRSWAEAVGMYIEDEETAVQREDVSVSVRPHIVDDFKHIFDTTKQMSGFADGDFSELAITLMPNQFLCKDYEKVCNGVFQKPNSVFTNHKPRTFCHEVMHYLLYVNTGNLNPDHKSRLFARCDE